MRTPLPTVRMTYRGSVVLTILALFVAGAVIGALGEAEREATPTDNAPDGYASTKVIQLQDDLPTGRGTVAIVVFSRDAGQFDRSQLRTLQASYASLLRDSVADSANAEGGGRPDGGQGATQSRGDGAARLQVSDDRTAAIGVIPIAVADEVKSAKAVTELRAAAAADLPSGVTTQVTGPAAIQADLADVFEGANVTLLLVTGAVVIVLLLITYRSPLLWIVPFVTIALADRVAVVVATQVLHALDVTWDASTTGILSVLVFGAGTDYALLVISRYRDELRVHEDRLAAMTVTLRESAEAVFTSAGTVLIGLLTLLLSVVPATRGLGLACAVGVAVAAVFVMTVLPAFLVLFGRWIFWPVIPRTGQAGLADARGFWRRVGDAVARRPVVYAAGSLVILSALSIGLVSVNTGLSQSEQFLDTPESITAADRISESFPAGTSNPTIVVTEDDASEVADAAAASTGVASARTVSEGDGLARIDVVVDARSGSDEAEKAITDLRQRLSSFEGTWVGGGEAETIDDNAAASRDRLLIVPLVLVLVLFTLMALLRSVVAPVLLVLTVVATYLAALGASWWLFTAVFGFERMDVSVPLFAFVFLVALGVDYNIFLVSRAAEESRVHGIHDGMLRGLAATGGVITSAGILLAAVFAALGVLPLVVLAQLGIVIFVGVLLDTLLVRTVLVPSLALILEDRFWWPRRPAVDADAA